MLCEEWGKGGSMSERFDRTSCFTPNNIRRHNRNNNDFSDLRALADRALNATDSLELKLSKINPLYHCYIDGSNINNAELYLSIDEESDLYSYIFDVEDGVSNKSAMSLKMLKTNARGYIIDTMRKNKAAGNKDWYKEDTEDYFKLENYDPSWYWYYLSQLNYNADNRPNDGLQMHSGYYSAKNIEDNETGDFVNVGDLIVENLGESSYERSQRIDELSYLTRYLYEASKWPSVGVHLLEMIIWYMSSLHHGRESRDRDVIQSIFDGNIIGIQRLHFYVIEKKEAGYWVPLNGKNNSH